VSITLGLGLFMPLLGISILALLVFDFVVVRHVPPFDELLARPHEPSQGTEERGVRAGCRRAQRTVG